MQIWGRPLSDGACAAGIFNLGENIVEVNVAEKLAEAGWPGVRSCRDLWRQKECPPTFSIPSHGVLLVKFQP